MLSNPPSPAFILLLQLICQDKLLDTLHILEIPNQTLPFFLFMLDDLLDLVAEAHSF